MLHTTVHWNFFILIQAVTTVMAVNAEEDSQMEIFDGNRVRIPVPRNPFETDEKTKMERMQTINTDEQLIRLPIIRPGSVLKKTTAKNTPQNGKSIVQEIPYVSDRLFNEILSRTTNKPTIRPKFGTVSSDKMPQFEEKISDRSHVEIFDREKSDRILPKLGGTKLFVGPAQQFRPKALDSQTLQIIHPPGLHSGDIHNQITTGMKPPYTQYGSPSQQPPGINFGDTIRPISTRIGHPISQATPIPTNTNIQPSRQFPTNLNQYNINKIAAPPISPSVFGYPDGKINEKPDQYSLNANRQITNISPSSISGLPYGGRIIRPPGENVPVSLPNDRNVGGVIGSPFDPTITDVNSVQPFLRHGIEGVRVREKIIETLKGKPTEKSASEPIESIPSQPENFGDDNKISEIQPIRPIGSNGIDNNDVSVSEHNTGAEAEGNDVLDIPEQLEQSEETAVTLELIAAVIEAAAGSLSVIGASVGAGVIFENARSTLPPNINRDTAISDVIVSKQETELPELGTPTREELKQKAEETVAAIEVLVAVMESAAAAVGIAGAIVATDVLHKEKELVKSVNGGGGAPDVPSGVLG